MEDEWKELVQTVPDTLMEVANSEEALRLVGLARRKLDARVSMLRTIRLGASANSAVEGFVDPAPVGVCHTEILEQARREIKRCSSLHSRAGHVLPICCERLDIVPSEERCRSWDGHTSAALHHADDAQKRLGNAASSARACKDAISIAGTLPVGTPLSRDWMLAAEQLLNGAIIEVTQALHLVHQMRRAVSLQFFDAWMILKS